MAPPKVHVFSQMAGGEAGGGEGGGGLGGGEGGGGVGGGEGGGGVGGPGGDAGGAGDSDLHMKLCVPWFPGGSRGVLLLASK